MGVNICAVCAWRETCNKKFSMSGSDASCSDFVKDVSIKDNKEEEDKAKE